MEEKHEKQPFNIFFCLEWAQGSFLEDTGEADSLHFFFYILIYYLLTECEGRTVKY